MEKIHSTIVFHKFKNKTLATILCVIASVLLPQIFHLVGQAFNLGSQLGEMFLPMHFSIFLLGLIAGWQAGLIGGVLSPLISFSLSQMPNSTMLPFMTIELAVYGLASGLLANKNLHCILKILIAQILGRMTKFLVLLIGANFFSSPNPTIVLKSIYIGIFGILLQLILIPLVVYAIKKGNNNE